MPPSPDCIIRNLRSLIRNLRTPGVPDKAEIPDLAADWTKLLAGGVDADLDAAVVAHLRAPSPFWPTPGQLLALVPSRQIAAADDAEDAWSATLLAMSKAGGSMQTESGRWWYPEPTAIPGVTDEAGAREILRGLGGRNGWMATPIDKQPFFRRDFVLAYRARRKGAVLALNTASVRQIADALPPPRVGRDMPRISTLLPKDGFR